MTKEIVVITGSTGLIGTAVARRLAPEFTVIGLDTHPPANPDPGRERVFLDLTSDDSVRTALELVHAKYGARIASFIHLAAHYDFSGEPSPLYESVTVRGTERVLRHMKLLEVEQFVFSSTMLVHAPCKPGERISEESPLLPTWDYPKSKVDTEQLIHEQHGQVPSVNLRIAGVYDDRCHSVPLANQIQRIYERRLVSHLFPGDTLTGQAFVHLEDVSEAIAQTVARRAVLPREVPLLIGEPETVRYEELQRTFGRLIHGEEWETRQIPKAVAKAGAWLKEQAPGEDPFIKPWMIDLADDHFELDVTRAKQLLCWEPRRTLRGTLPLMIQALKADPVAFYRDNQLELPSFLADRADRSPTQLHAE
jgi:nucleoside-diphosphate-sugar epimerase